MPLAGVPVKAAADYLRQLVAAGHRVAICEQVEDPEARQGTGRAAKSIETVTPGALLAGGLARRRAEQLHRRDRRRPTRPADSVGLAAIDLSTGEFLLETVDRRGPARRRSPGSHRPRLVVPAGSRRSPPPDGVLRTARERWEFDPELAREELAPPVRLASLDGLGIGPGDAPAVGAAGALLRYLAELQPAGLPHLARPARAPQPMRSSGSTR